MSKTSKLVARTNTLVTCEHAYLRDDGCAVVLGPDRGRGTLVGSGALSVAPPTFSHPWWQQAWSTGGQLITARANQRDLSDLGWRQMSYYSSQKRNQGPGCTTCSKPWGTFLYWLCVSMSTLFPVASSRAPSESSSATLAETGLESRRMFTWGEANRENTT